MLAIEDRLKAKAIRVELTERGLAFIPKANMDDNIRGALATEGKRLFEDAIAVRSHLQALSKDAESSPGPWKARHDRLTAKWPWDDPDRFDAYAHLVAWSGAWLMRTTALNALTMRKGKRPLSDPEKGGKRADISFSARWIPNAERRLVGACILWPFIRKKVMGLKTRDKTTEQEMDDGREATAQSEIADLFGGSEGDWPT
tara:strand:+ start:394 stop:996 length:603 start_codon:yes stop_codon:yes gene_type:complete